MFVMLLGCVAMALIFHSSQKVYNSKHTSYHYQKYTDFNQITLIHSLGLAPLSENSKDIPSYQKEVLVSKREPH